MNGYDLSWLISLICSLAFIVSAKSIDVDLQSNWIQSPYRLQLIESLAKENSSLFYPLVSQVIASEELEGKLTDKVLHDRLIEHFVENQLLTENQAKFAELSAANNRYSALIQAQYQYYQTEVLPKFKKSLPDNCENLFYYNGAPNCDPGKVYALETDAVSDTSILPTDRVFTVNPDAPIGVLYGDLETESFAQFHSALISSALEGKVQYILRYKPSESKTNEKESLAGYGVEIYVKRTDYLVIDDRNSAGTEEEEILKLDKGEVESSHDKTTHLKANLDPSAIDKKKLQMLGNRAAGYIKTQEDQFEALKDISLNFPKYAASLAELDTSPNIWKEVQQNVKSSFFGLGQNTILVNGAHLASVSSDNIFTLLEQIDREREFVASLSSRLDISEPNAASLISRNLLGEIVSQSPKSRYDYRTEGLFWINDISTDSRFKSWSPDLSGFLKPRAGHLSEVRRNAHSLVFLADLSAPEHLKALGNVLSLLYRGLPLQIGVIPFLGTSKEGDQITKELLYLQSNRLEVPPYLLNLIGGRDRLQAFESLVGVPPSTVDLDSDEILEKYADLENWFERFDISSDLPSVFVNGALLDASNPNWLTTASGILEDDNEVIRNWIKDDQVDDDSNLRDQFLVGASKGRNQVIAPVEPLDIIYRDTEALYKVQETLQLPSLEKISDPTGDFITVWALIDLTKKTGLEQIVHLLKYVDEQSENNIRVSVIPVASEGDRDETVENKIVADICLIFNEDLKDSLSRLILAETIDSNIARAEKQVRLTPHIGQVATDSLIGSGVLRSLPGDRTFIVNGRIVELPTIFKQEQLSQLISYELKNRIGPLISKTKDYVTFEDAEDKFKQIDRYISLYSKTYFDDSDDSIYISQTPPRVATAEWIGNHSTIHIGEEEEISSLGVVATIDPLSENGQYYITILNTLSKLPATSVTIFLTPAIIRDGNLPLKRFYRSALPAVVSFNESGAVKKKVVSFEGLPRDTLLNMDVTVPPAWVVTPYYSQYDLENIVLDNVAEGALQATYELNYILLEGHGRDLITEKAPRGLAIELGTSDDKSLTDTSIMSNLGYFQLKANPGMWHLNVKSGRSSEVYSIVKYGTTGFTSQDSTKYIWMTDMSGTMIYPIFQRKKGMENVNVWESSGNSDGLFGKFKKTLKSVSSPNKEHQADINIFTVASGHLYERFLSIMTASVMKHTDHTVKFWLIENFLSPSFKRFVPYLAEKYGFEYELITYKWPSWLQEQTEKQRTIWGYKILFLDVLFPQSLDKVIFVDADQIVRTDMNDLVELDLHGAPYGYTPMGDSRDEMEGFRFWKQGYWKNYLKGKPYHISALYVIDLIRFRELAAGDKLRQHYQLLSRDPGSLSNLDQDLPNHLQHSLPIFSLPQDWLWCETWCSDESLLTAKTIDLCNNPLTKEPKLDRARRQIPEWTEYDDQIAELAAEVEEKEREREKERDIVEERSGEVSGEVTDEEEETIHDEL